MTLDSFLEKQFILRTINVFISEIVLESSIECKQHIEDLDKKLTEKFSKNNFLENNYKSVIELDVKDNLIIGIYKNKNLFISLTLNFE